MRFVRIQLLLSEYQHGRTNGLPYEGITPHLLGRNKIRGDVDPDHNDPVREEHLKGDRFHCTPFSSQSLPSNTDLSPAVNRPFVLKR